MRWVAIFSTAEEFISSRASAVIKARKVCRWGHRSRVITRCHNIYWRCGRCSFGWWWRQDKLIQKKRDCSKKKDCRVENDLAVCWRSGCRWCRHGFRERGSKKRRSTWFWILAARGGVRSMFELRLNMNCSVPLRSRLRFLKELTYMM